MSASGGSASDDGGAGGEQQACVQDNAGPANGSAGRLGRLVWALLMAWTFVVGVLLLWAILQRHAQAFATARQHAGISCERDIFYHQWSAGHRGVYTPVTSRTAPNDLLRGMPEREIAAPSGRQLTLVSPSRMTRHVLEAANRQSSIIGHITSLSPVRSLNAADPWETAALEAFQHGSREVSGIQEMNGKPYMRLMRPLVADPGCLSCHGSSGPKVGEVLGGISISVPLEPLLDEARASMLTVAGGYAVLWLSGVLGLLIGARRLRDRVYADRQGGE